MLCLRKSCPCLPLSRAERLQLEFQDLKHQEKAHVPTTAAAVGATARRQSYFGQVHIRRAYPARCLFAHVATSEAPRHEVIVCLKWHSRSPVNLDPSRPFLATAS